MPFDKFFRRPEVPVAIEMTENELARQAVRARFFETISFPRVQSHEAVQWECRDVVATSLALDDPWALDQVTRELTGELRIDRADRFQDNKDRRKLAIEVCVLLVTDEQSLLSAAERAAVLQETAEFLTTAYEGDYHSGNLQKYTCFIRAFQDLHERFSTLRVQLQTVVQGENDPGLQALNQAEFNQWKFRQLYSERK